MAATYDPLLSSMLLLLQKQIGLEKKIVTPT
jgi:hypothetical protein